MPHRRNRSDGTNESRRKFLKASGAGAVALSLAGCSGTDEQDETETTEDTGTTEDSDPGTTESSDPDEIPEGGTFVMGFPESLDTSNVMMASSVYTMDGLNLVYDFGVSMDPDTFEVKPWVFTDWELEDPSAEEPEIVFNVRDGLTFNDGEDVTIEDVMFSYNYVIENQIGEWSTAWTYIDEVVEDDGDWDLRMKTLQPYGAWDSSLLAAVPIIPKHIWENVDDYQSYEPFDERENGPVGSGPGVLTQFQPDTSMQVEFRDDYTLQELDWIEEHDRLNAGGPFLDKVNFKIFGESSAMTQAMMRGEIDTHYGSLETDRIPEAEQSDGISLVGGYDSGFQYIGFNLRREPMDDLTFRQAMSFLWDEVHWVRELQNEYVIDGDLVQAPGYDAVRPETVFGGEMLEDPAMEAFTFRASEGPEPDVEGVRAFLEEGNVIDGSEGTYAGQDYPGSLSGAEASMSESKHDYSFDEAQSDVLTGYSEQELHVNGEPLSEITDGGLQLTMDPPGDKPKQGAALSRWVENLKKVGIPVRLDPTQFNTITEKAAYTADFDMIELGWGGTGTYGTSVEFFFHSDFTKEVSGEDSYNYNSTGYGAVDGGGADEQIRDAVTEMEIEARNEKTATVIEKIYLDMPYMVFSYDDYQWPFNSADFGGAVEDIVDPGYASWTTQAMNIYQKE